MNHPSVFKVRADRFWAVWNLSIKFLLDGRTQSLFILIGVAVGVSVTVFISALILGLQSNIIERTLGTQAHIQLTMPDEKNQRIKLRPDQWLLVEETPRPQRIRAIDNWRQINQVLDNLPEIKALSPLVSGPALAQKGDAVRSVALMGIEPALYEKIIPLSEYLVQGNLLIDAGNAVIGVKLAERLGLKIGGKLRLETGQGHTAIVNVTGIVELGVRELDERYVYLDLKQTQALVDLPGGVTEIDIIVGDIFKAKQLGHKFSRLLGIKAESWMESNAQLLNALKSQSLSTNLIVVFVSLSVALGIASVLSVSVVQRTREIGILRAIGASRQQILQVFLLQGALFGALGSIAGVLISAGLLWIFNTYGPKLFYISMSWTLILSAVTLAFFVGFIAAYFPSRKAANLDPVEAIRHV